MWSEEASCKSTYSVYYLWIYIRYCFHLLMNASLPRWEPVIFQISAQCITFQVPSSPASEPLPFLPVSCHCGMFICVIIWLLSIWTGILATLLTTESPALSPASRAQWVPNEWISGFCLQPLAQHLGHHGRLMNESIGGFRSPLGCKPHKKGPHVCFLSHQTPEA